MRINALRRVTEILNSGSIGFNLHARSVFIRGALPWTSAIEHRQWVDTDDIAATDHVQHRRLFVGVNTVSRAVDGIAVRRPYWPSDAPIPQASARLERNRDIWQWVLEACPYCGARHRHGGGKFTDDPRELLSHRTEHCAVSIEGARGYVLVESRAALRRAGSRRNYRNGRIGGQRGLTSFNSFTS